jgi:enoyl-CoA hydratase/carnithine racemase
MSGDPVNIERRGHIAVATLNEPETRNALSDGVVMALLEFLENANTDKDLACIVLTGAGKGFCSGGNVSDMHKQSHPMFSGSPSQMQEAYRRHIQRIPLAFDRLDIPVIAAVNGAAIGAGCDIACMCDIRVASSTAVFAESFLRVGLISGDGGAWYLPRVIGQARAMEMALTCDPVTAEMAEAWGLVSHVVPPESLLEKAVGIAEKIAAFPPISVRLNKRLMRQSARMDLPESLEMAAAYQSIIQHTADHREAVAALIEKRKPQFRNL